MPPDKIIKQIRELADPLERWQAAEKFKETYRDATYEIADVRRDVVRQLRRQGNSLGKIADKLGIARSRVQRLLMSREEVTEQRRDGDF